MGGRNTRWRLHRTKGGDVLQGGRGKAVMKEEECVNINLDKKRGKKDELLWDGVEGEER